MPYQSEAMLKPLLSAFITAILFLPPGYAFSQNKMKLTGTVSDSTKPLSLVTVRLFKKNNTTPLSTTVSKEDGSFQLNKPDPGTYTLSFTHTGFAEKQLSVAVSSQAGDLQVEPVTLTKATGVLKEEMTAAMTEPAAGVIKRSA